MAVTEQAKNLYENLDLIWTALDKATSARTCDPAALGAFEALMDDVKTALASPNSNTHAALRQALSQWSAV